ncbi:unnamed protein product, partial [Protopolystoma xenopodis]
PYLFSHCNVSLLPLPSRSASLHSVSRLDSLGRQLVELERRVEEIVAKRHEPPVEVVVCRTCFLTDSLAHIIQLQSPLRAAYKSGVLRLRLPVHPDREFTPITAADLGAAVARLLLLPSPTEGACNRSQLHMLHLAGPATTAAEFAGLCSAWLNKEGRALGRQATNKTLRHYKKTCSYRRATFHN